MAVFRIERTRDYTVMSNHHLRDKALSLKSKGLLSMMLSLPEDWNYTTRGLAKICKEGVDAIGGALRELESAGYIGYGFTRYGKPVSGWPGYGKAGRIKYREIKDSKTNNGCTKYRFHSLPGESGGQAAGTERTGCDVGGRNAGWKKCRSIGIWCWRTSSTTTCAGNSLPTGRI